MSRARVRRSGVEEGAVEFIFLGDEELELRLRGEAGDLLESEVERGGVRGPLNNVQHQARHGNLYRRH